MKARFPLSVKILLWFFLNLLVVAAGFYGLLRFQFHFGLDSLLAGRAGERMEAVGGLIAAELAGKTEPAQWEPVLARFSAAYGVKFAIFGMRPPAIPGPEPMRSRRSMGQIAGPLLELPEEVFRRIQNAPGRRAGARREWHDDNNRPRPPEERPRPDLPRRLLVRTESPEAYWVLLPLRLEGADFPGGPPPILVMRSDSLGAGGLIFDPAPWVAVGAGVLVFSVLFWLPLVGGITRAISQMTAATERIAGGDFEARLALRRGDELGLLAEEINRMAGKLAGYVGGQKRFLGDTAHELCAPLARMQMALGILEQRADARQKDYVQDVREELQHMAALVNELLDFSKAAVGGQSIPLESVPLAELVAQVIHREGADDAGILIKVPGDLCILAAPNLLQRAVGNVLRNALRYAVGAGPVRIEAAVEGDRVRLTISDCGPGIPEEMLGRVFDPFFRIDASRDRETGGVGLGLAITRTCIESCGGTVRCRNLQPHGLAVEMDLPTA